MKIDTAAATRLGIFFFYDADGVVDEYVLHFLREMNRSLTRLIVVCNGDLTDAGRAALESVGASPVIQRDNEGFDVWAYKTAIDFVGWDGLAEFDEIILMNFTVMGPFGSFEPMFAEMDSRDVDFWGMTIHHGADFDPWGVMPDGVVPPHIQSHFIAVRRTMVTSEAFQNYWDTMFPVNSYEDSVGRHESLFTQRFEREGFAWSVYVDTTDLIDRAYYPLFNAPVEMLETRASPIFKRKGFFALPETYLDETSNRASRQLLDYLKVTDGYDADLIVEHVVRTANNYDLAMALNLVEVLSSREPYREPAPDLSVAVVVAVRSAAELATKRRFLEAAPPSSEIFIVSPEPVDISSWDLPRPPRVEIATTPDVSALQYWHETALGFDLICVVEPAEADGLFPFTNQEAATEHYLDSVLASRDYTARVVAQFAENPRLGAFVPLHPVHHTYFGDYGHEWGDDYDAVSGALAAAGARAPISASRPPIASESGVFWTRSAAVKPLFESPAVFDGLTARARRLATPFLGQSVGFYTSYVAPETVLAGLLTTVIHFLRGVSQRTELVPLDPSDKDSPNISTITRLFARLERVRDHERILDELQAELFDVSAGFSNSLEILGNKDREIGELYAKITRLEKKLRQQSARSTAASRELQTMKSSRVWRISRTLAKPFAVFRR